jgi:hypothetical protein
MEDLHLLSLAVTVPFILYSDHLGLKYMLGKINTLDLNTTKKLHLVVFIGLGLLIFTGAALTIPDLDYYLQEEEFLLKMFFVLTLTLNGLFIGKLMKLASQKTFKELTTKQQLTLLISGATSATCWLSSFIIGYFFL